MHFKLNLSPIQQLDLVLDLFANKLEGGCYSKFDIQKFLWEISEVNIELIALLPILNRLIKDGNIELKEEKGPGIEPYFIETITTVYSITFDGEVFNQEGGYEEQVKRKDAKFKLDESRIIQAEKNAERLNTFTLYLAFGTGALAAIEIFKLIFCK